MNAAQIFQPLKEKMDLATVYRGLDFLEKEGHLQAFVFECRIRGIERYFYANTERHQYYLHCETCHQFYSMGTCPLEGTIGKIEEDSGVRVRDHQVILKGACRHCCT